MKAVWNRVVLADSDETIVVEGNHYFPPESVDFSKLEASWMRSLCFWKGIAGYYSVEAGERATRAPRGRIGIRSLGSARSATTWRSGAASR